MHVEDARVELTDGIRRIRLGAEIVPDVKAKPHARIQILDHVPGLLAGREEIRDVRAMVVDRIADVVRLAESRHILAERTGFHARVLAVDHLHLERNAHHRLHADALGELERLLGLFLRIHIDRAETIAGDAVIGALLLELRDLRIRGLERQVEVLDAEVLHVKALQQIKRFIRRKPIARIPGHAELELDLAAAFGAAAVRTCERLASRRRERERGRCEKSTTSHHKAFLLFEMPTLYRNAEIKSNHHRLQNGTAAVPKRAQRKMSAMMDILRFTNITIAKSASANANGRKMNVPSAANPHTLSAQNR